MTCNFEVPQITEIKQTPGCRVSSSVCLHLQSSRNKVREPETCCERQFMEGEEREVPIFSNNSWKVKCSAPKKLGTRGVCDVILQVEYIEVLDQSAGNTSKILMQYQISLTPSHVSAEGGQSSASDSSNNYKRNCSPYALLETILATQSDVNGITSSTFAFRFDDFG